MSGDGCASDAADNTRSLNNTDIFVANFRKSVVDNPPPEGFALASPSDGAIGVEIPVALAWQPSLFAFEYDVTVATDASLHTMETKIALQTSSGVLEAAADVSRPATDLEVQGAKLRAKFDALTGPILGPARAAELGDRLADVAGFAEVGDLLAMAR